MRVNLFWRILPVYVLIALFFALPLWQRYETKVNAQRAGNLAEARLSASKTHKHIEGLPTKIVIPRLAINLSVVPQPYSQTQKTWPVADSSANYAMGTPEVNNEHGLTLIYGHWTPKVFGPTKQLAAGDIAYVYTDNGHVFKYIYSDKKIVKPADVQSVNKPQGKPGLILMTCDGSWAQVRRLMYFDLVNSR